MAAIREHKINIPQAKIDRLNQKLDLTDWPEEIDGGIKMDEIGFDLGAPVADIKRIAQYWRHKFSWREQEAKLNALPNFMTTVHVDGFGDIDMHFLHAKSSNSNAIPLLFAHGWPGSFLEATKLIRELEKVEGGLAFSVVAPSMPNYVFSGPMRKRGFNVGKIAESFHKVMLTLGYDQYVTQGGDWGLFVTRALAYKYPQHVKAQHVNWAFAAKPSFNASNPEPTYSEREKKQMRQHDRWFPYGSGDGRGYIAIHSTKPATINFLLKDSPVGLLAWIYDKLVDWTDSYPWTEEEVCLWVSLYVFSTAGPEASTFVYYEALHDTSDIPIKVIQSYIDVPLGISDFPCELSNSPRSWHHTMGPIVVDSVHEKGGHFAGWERPDAIAADLCEMFRRGGGAYGVVHGRDGY